MYSPKSKSFVQKNKLNQSFNQSFKSPLNNSLSLTRSSKRRRTAVFGATNKSFLGLNQSRNKSNNALNASLMDKTAQDESCFQIVDFKGHVPNTITNVIMDCQACMHLKLQLSERGVACLSSLHCIYVWNFISNRNLYELSMPYMSPSSSAFDQTSSTSFIQAALSIPEGDDDDDLQMDSISCVAVMTTGSVFYWKSIAYSRSFIEMKITSDRGENDVCVDVVSVGPGFVVGWMSGALTYLFPSQNHLRQSSLKAQPGARLTNIGRRVSSLFFGASQQSNDALTCGALRKLAVGRGEEGGWRLVVMCESSLQLWSAEKMHYDVNLVEMLKTYMMMQGSQEAHLEITLQDVQLTGTDRCTDRLTILFGTNDDDSITHHIVFMDASSERLVIQKLVNTAFNTVIMNGSYKSFNLLTPNPSDTLLYSIDSIICAKDLDTRDEEDEEDMKMEVFKQMNVGAGVYKGHAVFLTNQSSLISIRQSAALLQLNVADTLLKSTAFADLDETEENEADLLTRFKHAFISSMIHNENKSFPNAALIDELLAPNNTTYNTSLNTTLNNTFNTTFNTNTTFNNTQQQLQLDDIVVRLSRDMIDDYPSADPSTSKHKSATSKFTTSMMLEHQLEDKMKAHHLLIAFLHQHDLWDKLSWTRDVDGYQATTSVLCQHAQKLACVGVVKELYNKNSSLLGAAIDKCMQSRHSHTSNLLTTHDHFFRQVSKVQHLIRQQVEVVVDMMDKWAVVEGGECVEGVLLTSEVIEIIMNTALTYRSTHTPSYPPPPTHLPGTGGLRLAHQWTSSPPLMTALHKLHAIIHGQVIPALNEDSPLRGQLFEVLFNLTEHMLGGMREYVVMLEGVGGVEKSRLDEVVGKYEQTRSDLIHPFVSEGQTERAMALAEDFHHFELLVQLNCSNHQRLETLMNTFRQHGFPDVVFNWMCKNGKRHFLLTYPLLHHPDLEVFITQPPHKQLSWIYYASKKLYYQAFNIVFELAMEKVNNLGEKLNLLSYAKLYGSMCSKHEDVPEKLLEVEECLSLIDQQLLIFKNPTILEYLAIEDSLSARVYSPFELIDLLVGTEGQDEDSLKMAFGLLNYINPEQHSVPDLIMSIWTAAILNDDWSGEIHPTDPLTSLQHLTIFKLITLLIELGTDVSSLLPPATTILTHPPLANLTTLPSFNLKLLTLLEHAQRASTIN